MGQQQTEHQQMGQQQMGSSNYPQGASEQQMNGGVGQQAAQPDNRDTLTKCNDNPSDCMIEIDRHLLFHFAQENNRRLSLIQPARTVACCSRINVYQTQVTSVHIRARQD